MGKKAKVLNSGGDSNNNPEKEEKYESPFRDNSIRFAVDALLRDNGFEIWERKDNKEPKWIKRGEKYPQLEALYSINKDKVEDAMYMELLYFDGLVYEAYSTDRDDI